MGRTSNAEVKQRVVRWKGVKPLGNAYDETQLDAHKRVLFRYFGNAASDAKDVPPGAPGIEMNMALVQCAPGTGAPLHQHECEEIFFAVNGKWIVYFGDNGEEEVLLDEWDAVSIPADVHRGFKNAGGPDGVLMALLGRGKTALPIYREDYSKLPQVVSR
jgi:mannose-6-phosphate isomerase-like protein (cupin superfamily)